MTLPIDAPTAERLAKICGMLGSAHAGERDAAALAATRLLHASGITWYDLVMAAAEVSAARYVGRPHDRAPMPSTPQHLAAEILRRFADELDRRELAFLDRMASWHGLASEKQRRWLSDIASRFHEVAA